MSFRSIHAIDAIVVLYNSADSIGEAIRTLPESVHVLLVENLPGDGSVDAALQVRPDATVLRPGKNLGFGGACNLAIGASTSPWILLLNPDAQLAPGCLDALLQASNSDDQIAALGPLVLRLSDGKIDTAGIRILAPGWTADRSRGANRDEAPASGFVEALSGGVLLLRRSALLETQMHPNAFWADLFLYSEDVDLSLALRRAGRKLFYCREAVAHHVVGASSSNRSFIRAIGCRNRIVVGLAHASMFDFISPQVWSRWGWRALMDWRRMLDNLLIPQLRTALPRLLRQIPARRRHLRNLSRLNRN
jgi:N-acetylglucosaminyl-diphospho-decaprenol L-rhamnosyltransferase